MRRTYAAILAAAAVCVFATAACDRRGRTPDSEPAPAPVVTTTTDRPAPAPEEPAAAAEQASTDLDSVDQVLKEIESDLSSVDAPPPDAD
jgi:hypothetical protein